MKNKTIINKFQYINLVNLKQKFLIYILLTNLQTELFSQDNLWNNRENINLKYKNYSDSSYRYTISGETTNILIGIYGSDSLEINHFFKRYTNGSIDNESLCDSLIINLFCKECVNYHLKKTIASKDRHWIKLSDSLYFSPKWVSKFTPFDKSDIIYTIPMMKITKEENVTDIILYTDLITKKKLNELKKGTK